MDYNNLNLNNPGNPWKKIIRENQYYRRYQRSIITQICENPYHPLYQRSITSDYINNKLYKYE